MHPFEITSEFTASGDQPKAIQALVDGIEKEVKEQVLLGVTGSGKTFTMASIIEKTQRPAILIAHNKTLAAQLYEEMRSFFPGNAVEYFVSYYDYYQPEAYIPQGNIYIEKDARINEKIDILRHSATRSSLERRDVVVVASVSCIYGLGSPELYSEMSISLSLGMKMDMCKLQERLSELQYTHVPKLERGSFNVLGGTVSIFPSHYESRIWRISFFGDEIDSIQEVDPQFGVVTAKLEGVKVFPNTHYVTPRPTLLQAISKIEEELQERVTYYKLRNKTLEAERILERTKFDIEMMRETGSCKGIENYSRYFCGKKQGDPPNTLLDYLPEDTIMFIDEGIENYSRYFCGKKQGDPPNTLLDYLPEDTIMFIDESHMTISQLKSMYNGDMIRKTHLVNYGFRLPSAMDNRPLTFEEWEARKPKVIYVSATPGRYELECTNGVVVEQLIRPTGLLDPVCVVREAKGQIDDVVSASKSTIEKGYRVLVTTLTKKWLKTSQSI